MVVTITSRSSRQEIAAALQRLHKGKSAPKSKKVFDAYKHCGVIKLKEDPLLTQKRLRDEWA